ncbi:amidophosphoribosyltransferase [Thermus islandicus]|uniref:amidophosphoribosyltransferase n=1 Tax=Thermus islandicus TaxID=540988 RepID=UPI0003B46B9D|nr:amidophosphoribosyltransferase [Thermus islandicus]
MDKPKEECGVLGLWSETPLDVAGLLHLGLLALQHRGQEAAGIAVTDGKEFLVEKDLGLVNQVFGEERLGKLRLEGARLGIAHTRYSTTGSNLRFNAQPLTARTAHGVLAIAHNGNFTNAKPLRDRLLREGATFQSTSDTEVMLLLLARLAHLPLPQAAAEAMRLLEGGYSILLMDRKTLLALRDPHGVRPLVLGKAPWGFVFASEPPALALLGAEYLRDVHPGEVVWVEEGRLQSLRVLPPDPTPCAFEWIYFARPDSLLDGVEAYQARVKMGEELFREAPAEADIVVPVPDSGIGAAVGYARASGLPLEYGLYKNPYAGRTFIQPTQELRDLKTRLKLSPTSAVRGQRVVLIDDSIVRGTTSKRIVQMLKEAGAKAVHFRVSSPPIRFPCYYGIDTAARKELIAAEKGVEEIRAYIGADSLAFLSEEGVRRAIGRSVCLACFNGRYPAGVPVEGEKLALELG